MKKFILTLSLLSCISTVSYSQQDEEGCKDPAMFNRMPNFVIQQCSENFAALEAYVAAEKTEAQEGTLSHLQYYFNNESGAKKPSWLQISRNYENAIVKAGGKKVFANENYATFKIAKDGKETWVMVSLISADGLSIEQYWLDVVVKEEMKQDILASEMLTALNTNGSIDLYINFETGKSDIQSESQKIIEQVAQMMKENPAVKISIEGHTDNAGNEKANQVLSENRAKAVMNAVIAKGIDKSRMTSKGWGQTKSIADNNTEDGKAKNRRVAIVKM